MKKILILIVLCNCCFLNAVENEHQIARLHYKGGGDWYNDQDIIPNIVTFLNSSLQTNFSIIEATVTPDDQKLFDYPFIFMTGHGTIHLNQTEADNIRTYLDRGGFLYVDDDYGLDNSFQNEIKKVFPQKEMIELPASHEIFHCFYDFPEGLPKIHKHDDKRPQAFGIFDDNGRLLLLYTYESNISDGWSNVHEDPENIKELAFKFGVNLFYYIMTQ